jgi:hypothetical protein
MHTRISDIVLRKHISGLFVQYAHHFSISYTVVKAKACIGLLYIILGTAMTILPE